MSLRGNGLIEKKTLGEGETAVYQYFSFSCSVFKRFLSFGH